MSTKAACGAGGGAVGSGRNLADLRDALQLLCQPSLQCFAACAANTPMVEAPSAGFSAAGTRSISVAAG